MKAETRMCINGVYVPADVPAVHAEMYAEWVKRGKPQMELRRHSGEWIACLGAEPGWVAKVQYRFKDSPLDEKSKAMRHLLDELPIAKFDPRIAKEADAKVEAWMDSAIAKTQEHDAGQHYRKTYKGIKLDPARIVQIFNATHPMQLTIIKKALCAGERGHKDQVQDILDIKNACDRWLEMIAEDRDEG